MVAVVVEVMVAVEEVVVAVVILTSPLRKLVNISSQQTCEGGSHG